jgi:cysteine synthase
MMPSTSVLEAIGNTPLVQLRSVVPGGAARVFIKLEYYNPTGSYKDRMAISTIEGAGRKGKLRPGMRVVEYTGGSTGSSLALVCAAPDAVIYEPRKRCYNGTCRQARRFSEECISKLCPRVASASIAA